MPGEAMRDRDSLLSITAWGSCPAHVGMTRRVRCRLLLATIPACIPWLPSFCILLPDSRPRLRPHTQNDIVLGMTGARGDMHVYDPVAMAWTDLSSPLAGTPPSPRLAHGFATAADKLYVHAGSNGGGGRGAVRRIGV